MVTQNVVYDKKNEKKNRVWRWDVRKTDGKEKKNGGEKKMKKKHVALLDVFECSASG